MKRLREFYALIEALEWLGWWRGLSPFALYPCKLVCNSPLTELPIFYRVDRLVMSYISISMMKGSWQLMGSEKKGFAYLALAGFTAVLASSGAIAADRDEPVSIEEHTIQAPFNLTHPVLPADLLPSPGKELVTLGVDDNLQKWLGIYTLNIDNQRYSLFQKLLLPPSFYSFDISDESDNGQEKQVLYFLSSEHIVQYVPHNSAAPFDVIADIQSVTLKKRPDFISRGEFVRDLNGDKRADILISDFSQVRLLLGKAEGGFEHQSLPITPQVKVNKRGAEYIESKLYISDANFDGRDDIIKIAEGELEVYPQNETGMFNPLASYIPVRQAISGIDWWNKRDAFGESLDQSSLIYRKVEEVRDINNDGITDLVLRYTKSSGVLDRVNDYEVFLGEKLKDKLVFPAKASSVVRAEGTLTGLEFIDIDNDDKLEVMVAGFDIGLSQIIGALVSGSIDQDVYLFKMDNNSLFQAKPNVSKEVELSFSLTSGQSGSPVVKLADINGDKVQDLLLSDGQDRLKIFLGDPGGKLFKSRSEQFNILLPQEGGMLSSDDLDGDGKDDILIKYGRQDDDKLLSQFKVLISG